MKTFILTTKETVTAHPGADGSISYFDGNVPVATVFKCDGTWNSRVRALNWKWKSIGCYETREEAVKSLKLKECENHG